MRLEGPPAQQPAAAAPGAQQPPGEDPKKKEEEERRKEAEKDLPEGWAVAFDAQRKPYFWHKQVRAGRAGREEGGRRAPLAVDGQCGARLARQAAQLAGYCC